MKALEEIIELLSDHLDTNDDTVYTDRELLIELRKRVESALEADRVDVGICVEQAEPATVYEVVKAGLTPQKLTNLGVKLIYVNNRELFWVTTAGRLYEFKAYEQALQDEYNWLMSDPN